MHEVSLVFFFRVFFVGFPFSSPPLFIVAALLAGLFLLTYFFPFLLFYSPFYFCFFVTLSAFCHRSEEEQFLNILMFLLLPFDNNVCVFGGASACVDG